MPHIVTSKRKVTITPFVKATLLFRSLITAEVNAIPKKIHWGTVEDGRDMAKL